jgi:mannose-6-phosphate isomerase
MDPSAPVARRVDKPWGHEEIWAETSDYVGKILTIMSGHRLSLQHHAVKDETLRVAVGELELTLEDDRGVLHTRVMRPGDVARIRPRRRHRLRALSRVEVIEVSTPHLDDVVRHDDDYGRA